MGKTILITLLCVILTLAALFLCSWEIQIDLSDTTDTVQYGTIAKTPKAYFRNKILFMDVVELETIVSGQRDYSKLGTYETVYTAKFLIYRKKIVKTITVVDETPPEIILIGQSEVEIEQNAQYTTPGVIAFDVYDGDLSDTVIVKGFVDTKTIGTYMLEYEVKDKSGNVAKAIRKVTVKKAEIVDENENTNTLEDVSIGA